MIRIICCEHSNCAILIFMLFFSSHYQWNVLLLQWGNKVFHSGMSASASQLARVRATEGKSRYEKS